MRSAAVTVVSRTRERIARTSEFDPVSEDLLVGLARTLEKQLWMVRAQRPADSSVTRA
jgi:DNA-binding ferritin-like protein